MSNDTLTIIIVGIIAYILLTGQKASAAVSSAVTSACPRGKIYSRGFFGDCDPNYVMSGWMQESCTCLSAIPSSTPGTEHSPQTPQPKPNLCPWNSSLLAGDVRCQNPSQSTIIIGKPEPGFTECIIGAPKWDGGC